MIAETAWSLFSGVGGMDRGLALAGFRHTLFAEIDPWRRRVLAAHFPDVPILADVRLVDRCAAEPPDLICGGFPCQDLSVAGRRRGLAGERSGLFHEFARIADTVRPRWILLENVPGLLSSNDGRDMGTVVGTLADVGYGVAWRVLDARYYGVAQRRRRVFLVGHLGGDDESALRALCEICGGDLAASRCSWQGTPSRPGGRASYALTRGTRLGDGSEETLVVNALDRQRGGPDDNSAQAGHLVAFHQIQDPINSVEMSPALGRKSRGMGIAGASRVRRLTPIECERLMSWPDNWTAPEGVKAPDSRRYAACGDGVVANVAEWIGRRIIAEDSA